MIDSACRYHGEEDNGVKKHSRRTRLLGTLERPRAPERNRWKNAPEIEALLASRAFDACPEIDRTADPRKGPVFKDRKNPNRFGPFSILLVPAAYGTHRVPHDTMLARFPIVAAAVALETGVALQLPKREMDRWTVMDDCWQELWHAFREPRGALSPAFRDEMLRIFVPYIWVDDWDPTLNMTEFDAAASKCGLRICAGIPDFGSRPPGGLMTALQPPVTAGARANLLRPLAAQLRQDMLLLAKEAARFMPELTRYCAITEKETLRREWKQKQRLHARPRTGA